MDNQHKTYQAFLAIPKLGLLIAALILFPLNIGTAQQPSQSLSEVQEVVPVPPANAGLFSIPNTKPADRAPTSTDAVINRTVITARSSRPFQRESTRILKAVRPITRKFHSSVVDITCDGIPCAYGTIVGRKGLVVTKKSLLTRNILCAIGERSWKARVIASDQQKDLALLQLELESKSDVSLFKPISFPADVEFRKGKIVIGVGSSETPISFGMTTIEPQNINAAGDGCIDCIDMGLTLSPFAQPVTQMDGFGNAIPIGFGLKVLRVYPRTVSERLGILVGDQIQLVNNVPMQRRTDFVSVTANIKANQPITIVLTRNGQEVVIVDEVPLIAKKIVQDRWGGGPFNERRFGFGTVIIHDSVLKPEECGSPLIDLQGRFVGINIARSMRVASMSIPANQVLAFVRQHQPLATLSYADQTTENVEVKQPIQFGSFAN